MLTDPLACDDATQPIGEGRDHRVKWIRDFRMAHLAASSCSVPATTAAVMQERGVLIEQLA